MKIRNNEDDIKRLYCSLIGVNLSDNKLPSGPTNVRWLTKDRLWNLVFCFGMSCGFSITTVIAGVGKSTQEFSYWASFMFWLTIIGAPLLVRHFSKTTFVKETIFLNSEGKELDAVKSLPNSFITIVSTVVLTALIGMLLNNKILHISDAISSVILITVSFAVPTLFFIFKNCPISILFNYKFWVWKTRQNALNPNFKSTPYSPPRSANSSFRSNDLIMNPTYGGLSCNIYNSPYAAKRKAG
jgi:hypothetical protein